MRDAIFSGQSAGVTPRTVIPIAAIANARISTGLVRALTAQMYLRESYVSHVPVLDTAPAVLAEFESLCINLKRELVARDPVERAFVAFWPTTAASSVAEAYCVAAERIEAGSAILHAAEGVSERIVLDSYKIVDADLAALIEETGTPAGWYPIIIGYGAVPETPSGVPVPAEALLAPTNVERRMLLPDGLAELKRRLRALYETGRGGKIDEEDEVIGVGEGVSEDDDEAAGSDTGIPIPAETFIEELSQKLEVHPISVYWLLRELREKEGAVSEPEITRFVEEYVSVLVLRLLGHQWPSEIDGRQPLPTWADEDGIIPLTEGTNEAPLIARVRACLASDFGAEHAGAVEREFQEITGKPLTGWLASEFFKRHVSQFRKRPIAWQLTSAGLINATRRGRIAERAGVLLLCVLPPTGH
jgi:hypothetical protein